MAKHSIDRKTLKKDPFRDWMFDLIDRLYRRRIWLISAGLVVLAAAGAIVGFIALNNQRAEERAEQFYRARRVFLTEEKEDRIRLAKSREAFTVFVEAHPDATLTPYGWMYLARIAWDEKDLEAAKGAFQQAEQHARATPNTRHMALIGQARVREARGEWAAAAEIYRALPDDRFGDLKKLGLGRLAVASRNPAEARKHLEELAKRFPPDRLSQWASEELSVLP